MQPARPLNMPEEEQKDQQCPGETIDLLRRALEDRDQTIQSFAARTAESERALRLLADRVTARETELNRILNSRAWKWVSRYGRLKRWLFRSSAAPPLQVMLSPYPGVRREFHQEVYYSLPGELVPPPELQAYVGGGFRETGREFLGYFREFCGLQANGRVLDVGCGSGRMALPLTSYLSAEGRYEGFDISREAIGWCAENITPRFPNFHFQVSDVLNPSYNTGAKHRPADYIFPYEDGFFDLVFLCSVFTHMLPRDMEPYLAQISRVLKPGGSCLITFFLLNAEARKLMPTLAEVYLHSSYTLNFAHKVAEGCQAIDPHKPEDALAYDETYMRELFAKYQLTVVEPIHYGSWCGRTDYLSLQDIVVASKNGEAPALK
jgi:SAM-dependent methyltransferase